MGSAWFFLAVQVVNPSHGFDIDDFPQVTLCGCKVCVPKDYFAHDFNMKLNLSVSFQKCLFKSPGFFC